MAVSWSCHCLNVRLVPQSSPPQVPAQVDAKFSWVFVGDSGINVAHTQLTLRTRQYIPANDANGPTRQTLLRCLMCRIPVYRISSPAESAEDMMDGPVLDANVDLKDPPCSPDGWVEVSTSDCLDDDAARDVAHSSRWSPHFGLALPDPVESMITSAAPSMPPPVFPQLPESSPIFLPYPYTPADPVFTHLSSWAQNVSDNARTRAQAELNEFAQRKFDEFTDLDRNLRYEVDLIWANWRTAWQSQTTNNISRTDRPNSSSSALRSPPEPAVSIKDFNSIPSPPSARNTTSSRPASRVVSSSSLLSSSLGQMSPTSEQPLPHLYVRDPPGSTSAIHSSPDPPSGSRGIGIRPKQSKSPTSSARLLPQDTADESRAVAASFQIMMSDTMAGSRAAHLARVGLPATYTGEEENILEEDTSFNVEDDPGEPAFNRPPSQQQFSSLGAPRGSKGEKKRVQFKAQGPNPKPPQQREANTGEVSLFQLDLDPAHVERSKTELEGEMFADTDGLDDAEAYSRRKSRRPTAESEPSSRSGFIGSLPVDEELQKLVSVSSPTRASNGQKDWKQSARDRLRAEAKAQSMEVDSEQDDNDSLNDEVMVLPQIPRWKHKPADLAHSLPVSIGIAMPRNTSPLLTGFALEPKTSLVERKGILVPPLPRTNSGRGGGIVVAGSMTTTSTTATTTIGAGRLRSKSISSVARERTYAARDIQRSKDPGESLTVPDEDDDDDDDDDRSQEHDLDHIQERGRRNAYRILQRQSDVPDETMWRSLAG